MRIESIGIEIPGRRVRQDRTARTPQHKLTKKVKGNER